MEMRLRELVLLLRVLVTVAIGNVLGHVLDLWLA